MPGATCRPAGDIQAAFGKECLPLNLPAGAARRWSTASTTATGTADFGSVDAAHRALVEQVVEVDAAFVERYLNDGDVDASRIACAAGAGAARGPPDPGVLRLGAQRRRRGRAARRDRQAAAEPEPRAIRRSSSKARAPMPSRCTPKPDPVAARAGARVQGRRRPLRRQAWASSACTRARSRSDSLLYIGDGRKPFKVGHLFMLQGKEHVEVARALPGDICAVAKVEEIHFDAVLHDAAEDDHIHLKPLAFPMPVHGLAIEPKRRGDEQRMWEILQQAGRRGSLPEGRACGGHQRDHRLRPGRAAPAGAAGAPARRLQVRRQHPAAAHRLPRDDQRAGRGPPPAQEADRRRRPVRRGVPAASSRCRAAPDSSSSTRSRAARSRASSSRRSKRACARRWRRA